MINARCPKCGEKKFLVEYEGDEERNGDTIEAIRGGLSNTSGLFSIKCSKCGWEHGVFLGE